MSTVDGFRGRRKDDEQPLGFGMKSVWLCILLAPNLMVQTLHVSVDEKVSPLVNNTFVQNSFTIARRLRHDWNKAFLHRLFHSDRKQF
ncbi:hypothetical protein Hypma_007111 [Hypsizygus marmoreus]|uniref:Uncharacterized protein n=1 Tax=Hypsizygus marmoreus TaxID=39966 RepID=A0A369KA00_HYPMA|nr:hypothetical protein Hypma_007111 [Hypsizygus marmoreus]